MTLREIGSGVIYLGAIAGALVAIGAVLRVTIVTPLRRRIQEEVAAAVSHHEEQDHGKGSSGR